MRKRLEPSALLAEIPVIMIVGRLIAYLDVASIAGTNEISCSRPYRAVRDITGTFHGHLQGPEFCLDITEIPLSEETQRSNMTSIFLLILQGIPDHLQTGTDSKCEWKCSRSEVDGDDLSPLKFDH